MKFDSDTSPLRSAYLGRHCKEPTYVRAVRQVLFPGLGFGPRNVSAPRLGSKYRPASRRLTRLRQADLSPESNELVT
jgi:hypothetical protein